MIWVLKCASSIKCSPVEATMQNIHVILYIIENLVHFPFKSPLERHLSHSNMAEPTRDFFRSNSKGKMDLIHVSSEMKRKIRALYCFTQLQIAIYEKSIDYFLRKEEDK